MHRHSLILVSKIIKLKGDRYLQELKSCTTCKLQVSKKVMALA